jgi:enamine deaminase RidA (YjgF/YER057c/UK114 family)
METLDVIPLDNGLALGRTVRHGRWVFSQGNLASDLSGTGGIHDLVADASRRLMPRPLAVREADLIYAGLRSTLERIGWGLEHAVRIDQKHVAVDLDTPGDVQRTVNPYQRARHQLFPQGIPPSTTVVAQRLLSPLASLHLDLIAIDPMFPRRAVAEGGISLPPPSAGFVPVLGVGEFVFVAGQMADNPEHTSIADSVRLPPDKVWYGSGIDEQTRFLLPELIRSLEAGGGDPACVLHAQVFLRDADDLPQFNAAWVDFWGDRAPAQVAVAATDFGLRPGLVEVNLLGAVSGTKIQRVGCAVPAAPEVGPALVRVADVAATSGLAPSLMPGGRSSVAVLRGEPLARSSVARQVELVIDAVEAHLDEVGLGLSDVVRIVHYHRDLHDFIAAALPWSRRLGRPVPLSGVEMRGPLPSSDDAVLIECWAVDPDLA